MVIGLREREVSVSDLPWTSLKPPAQQNEIKGEVYGRYTGGFGDRPPVCSEQQPSELKIK